MKFTLVLLVIFVAAVFANQEALQSSEQVNNALQAQMEADKALLQSFKDQLHQIDGFFQYVHNSEEDEKTPESFLQMSVRDIAEAAQTTTTTTTSPTYTAPDNWFVKDPTTTGPFGVACVDAADCTTKNDVWYKSVKSRLMGVRGAKGHIGAKGPKGNQGLDGLDGDKGADGQQVSPAYLKQLAKQVAQLETEHSMDDSIIVINKVNSEVVLEDIYHQTGTNCATQRKTYETDCSLHEGETCTTTQTACCANGNKCLQALDALICCFQALPASDQQVNEWDLKKGATAWDMLQTIDTQQGTILNDTSYTPQVTERILHRFEVRNHICKANAAVTFTPTCPLANVH